MDRPVVQLKLGIGIKRSITYRVQCLSIFSDSIPTGYKFNVQERHNFKHQSYKLDYVINVIV